MTVAASEAGAGSEATSGNLQAVARSRKRAAFVGGVLTLLLLSLVARYILSPRPTSGDRFCTKVIDGDTIKLDDGERVRLIGVDTPEKNDRRPEMRDLAAAATGFTRRLCERRSVRLEYDFERQDRHGRTLAYVFLKDGTFVNAEIVQQGYGFAYTRFPFRYLEEFRTYEREARAAGRGLWASHPSPLSRLRSR